MTVYNCVLFYCVCVVWWIHEINIHVELYFKVYGTKTHYFSTHLGGIHSEGVFKSWVLRESKSYLTVSLHLQGVWSGYCSWVGQGRSYLALVELLSILRTAWAMASRSMPEILSSSCGLPLRGTWDTARRCRLKPDWLTIAEHSASPRPPAEQQFITWQSWREKMKKILHEGGGTPCYLQFLPQKLAAVLALLKLEIITWV